MAKRRITQGVGIGIIGLALALAPLTAAGAKSKPKHHSTKHTTTTVKSSKGTKGSNPNSALCKDLKAEQSQSEKLGSTIEAAIESGNYNTAKTEMVNSINAGLKDASPALKLLDSAPSAVQSAMKGLISFDGQFKTAIENSTSLTGLESSFASLGENPKLKTESTTV